MLVEFIRHYSKEGGCNYIGIMEITGKAYAMAYTFDDDQATLYLNRLSINLEYRNNGIGTQLQIEREKIAREKGYKYTVLWVRKGTWMRKWYGRRGYKYYKPYKEYKAVWLRKTL